MEYSCKHHVLTVLWTIVVMLTFPLTLSLLVPLYILRVIVKQLSKIFRKDLGKMITTKSTLFAAKEYPKMFQSGTRSSIYVTLVMDGIISLEAIRQLVFDRIVNVRKAHSSDLVYPEMRQTLTTWMGFLFWQWDKNFSIKKHVNMYTGHGHVDQLTEEYMLNISKDLLPKPFRPDQSPWEIWLWHQTSTTGNDKNGYSEQRPKTIAVFRVFHAVADGFSILEVLTCLTSSKTISIVSSKSNPKGKKSSCVSIIWKCICLPIKIVYEFVDIIIRHKDCNDWHPPESQLKGKINGTISDKLPVSLIKEIKNMYGTSFQAVLLAAFAGGIRNFMVEKGIKIPKQMSCQIPLPFSIHPTDKVRNHMTVGFFPLPIGISDPQDRLRQLHKSLRGIAKSTVTISVFYLGALVGALPLCLIKLIPMNHLVTCVMSNFPSLTYQTDVLGHPVEDITFGAGLLGGNTAVGAGSLTYNGWCRLVVGIDEAIMGQQEHIQDLMNKMIQELHNLKRGHEIV